MRGNVVDLAIAVIVGAAFGAIVTSRVNDVIMPVIGAVTGGLDFSNYYTAVSTKVQSGTPYADAKKRGRGGRQGAVSYGYPEFLIIACVLFIAIKGINKLKTRTAWDCARAHR